jgi:uncharacterized repeat protein (TIGR01451 family)
VVTDTLPTSGITFNAGSSTAGSDESSPGVVTWNIASLAAGASQTFTVVLDVAASAPAGLEFVTNVVEVSYDESVSGEDPTDEPSDPFDDNDDSVTTPLDAAPILNVIKDNTDADNSIKPGESLTYTVTIKNSGNQNAIVDIRDSFPDEVLDLSSAVISMANGVTGETTSFPGDIFWDNVEVDAGQTVVITITATAFDPALGGFDDIVNTVTVEDTTGEVPPVSDDDTVVLDAQPDLVVTKVNSTDQIGINDTFTYTITLENVGNQDSSNVVVVDSLPDHVVFNSATFGGVYDATARTVTWDTTTTPELALVLANGAEQFTFEVTVTLPVNSLVIGELTNVVETNDDGTNGMDPTPENNRDEVETDVFAYLYDSFNNFAIHDRDEDGFVDPIEYYRDALLPIAPIYSGSAQAGSIITLVLHNANGETVGRQTVVVDAGGNWLASFPGTELKDYPQSVSITQTPGIVSLAQQNGYNLRPYFAPAINTGHSFSEEITPAQVNADMASVATTNLYESLLNPVGFELGKYSYEFLSVPGIPFGR